ncbi:MAG: universal stress protein [Bacillota bacterium]
MKVLVLFDGSENAMRAVDFAGKLIKKAAPEAEVTLLQVVEFWETGAWGFLTLSEEKQGEVIAKAKQQAAESLEKAKNLLAEVGAPVNTEILVGEVIPTILDYAMQKQPDLIVMGSRGTGPVRELVLGGICHKVLQLAKQPVVVVK